MAAPFLGTGCLVFWGVCSALFCLSEFACLFLGEAFVWIRFPLFAFASCFWLARKTLVIAMMGMTPWHGDYDRYFNSRDIDCWPAGRTAVLALWRFGAWQLSGQSRIASFLCAGGSGGFCLNRHAIAVPAIVSFVTIILSVVTGERINFLIRACGGMLAGLVWRPKFGRYACCF